MILSAKPLAGAGAGAAEPNGSLWEKVGHDGSVAILARLDVGEVRAWRRAPVATRRARVSRARAQALRALRASRFDVRRTFEAIPAVALEVDADGLARLEASRSVLSITEDVPHAPALDRSTVLIQALAAWAGGADGAGQTVAVLDTGVDGAHPMLQGAVVDEACFSQSRSCPNRGRTQMGPGAAAPCTYSAMCAHGTHVAGIVAGHGAGLSGVAPRAGLVAIQVFSRSTDCRPGEGVPCPRTFTSDYLRALEYLLEIRDRHPLVAANLSFAAGAFSSPEACDQQNGLVKEAIDELRRAGIATVTAAGNDGRTDALASPACISSAISVGAVDDAERVSDFSNRAPFLSLLAPGRSIVSAVPDGGLAPKSGTSMAAPHVAGAWALLRQRSPEASVDVLRTALQTTGLDVFDGAGAAPARLIDVRAALDFMSGACPCRSDVESFCDYPRNACRMTTGGGYCDPNGDGLSDDGDWMRGRQELEAACKQPDPPPLRGDFAPWVRGSLSTPGSHATRRAGTERVEESR